MEKIVLTDEQKKHIIDETNGWIDEYNELTLDIIGLSDCISRIGLYQIMTAKPDDKVFYKLLRDKLDIKTTRRDELNHKILVNKKLLGLVKPKKKGLIKTRH